MNVYLVPDVVSVVVCPPKLDLLTGILGDRLRGQDRVVSWGLVGYSRLMLTKLNAFAGPG